MAVYRFSSSDFKQPPKTQKKTLPPLRQFRLADQTNSFACTLQYREQHVKVHSASPLPYGPTTVGYAVARYIKHCPQLRDDLVRRAVKLGLRTRTKPVRVTVKTSAASLDLPGSYAIITLVITQGIVTIDAVRVG